jgi:hypothetical protein
MYHLEHRLPGIPPARLPLVLYRRLTPEYFVLHAHILQVVFQGRSKRVARTQCSPLRVCTTLDAARARRCSAGLRICPGSLCFTCLCRLLSLRCLAWLSRRLTHQTRSKIARQQRSSIAGSTSRLLPCPTADTVSVWQPALGCRYK